MIDDSRLVRQTDARWYILELVFGQSARHGLHRLYLEHSNSTVVL